MCEANPLKLTPAEKKAIRALKNVAADWPDSLWLFCTGETLQVMRLGPDGRRVYAHGGGADQDYLIDGVDIPSDGGDF